MDLKQRENEDKIFAAVQDLKDSIFGMKQPYTPFCYDITEEDGLVFNDGRAAAFAAELSAFARSTRTYSEALAPAVPIFFLVTLRLLAAICSSGDWVFVSFRKLAKTVGKDSPEEESVYERIVDSHRPHIDRLFPDGRFWPDYDIFRHSMDHADSEDLFLCIKHTLEAFLDDRHLNALDHDPMTENISARISRLSAAVERDLRRAKFHGEDFL